MAPASFGQRAIARCIDLAILFFLCIGALSRYAGDDDAGRPKDVPVAWWILLAVAVLAYEVVPVRTRGQTPGKILTRIRVVPVDAPESSPTWRSSVLRWLPSELLLASAAAIGALVLPLLAIVYGSAMLDRDGRSWLDKLAGTRVVQAGRSV